MKLFFICLLSVLINVGGSCNTDYQWSICLSMCSKESKKNKNVKVFNLMSGVNETGCLVLHESCEGKCGLDESECHSDQKRIIMNM